MIFQKKKTVATHNGKFHADDLFAVATLELALGKLAVTRTRDPQKIAAADYVVDVGHIYNPTENRFDHHQAGGAGMRENKIPYASFGLVWKKYGEKIAGSKEIADMIDEKICTPLDAGDNGISITTPIHENVYEYTLHSFLGSFLPTWKDESQDFDGIFLKLIPIARGILEREITQAKATVEARKITMEIYEKMPDKRLLILDRYYPWHDVPRECPELLFAVHPDSIAGGWRISGVQKSDASFELRRALPAEWGGKEKAELQKITGISDATFCHKALFLAGAESKESILKMAEIALR